MCEQTEINYLDGDIVWVKLGACWWPGQVTGFHNLPEDIQIEFQKKPLIAAVKFFQEDTYEFVKNLQQIYKYNCTQKDDFIKKGLDKYRIKSKDGTSYMDKFPGDVEMAEKLTGGDPDILTSDKFGREEKPDISALFGEKKIPKRKRERDEMTRRSEGGSVPRKITHPRFLRESDHEIRIRQQPSSLPSTPRTPSTDSPQFSCHLCSFTSTRVNVIICHRKSHCSGGVITPISRPRITSNTQPKSSGRSLTGDSQKRKYVRKTKSLSSKGKSDVESEPVKRKLSKQIEKATVKKKKTDPELREKLLADWDDESDEDMDLDLNKSVDSGSIGSPAGKISSREVNSSISVEDKEDEMVDEGTEIMKASEKLLRETDKFASLLGDDSSSRTSRHSNNKHVEDEDSETDTSTSTLTKNEKSPTTKKPKKQIVSTEERQTVSSEKDDKQSRFSCFDFDEEDLPEPSITPVRKIPRVFGEKNTSVKKEILKKFTMSQALKNEKNDQEKDEKSLNEQDFSGKKDPTVKKKNETGESPRPEKLFHTDCLSAKEQRDDDETKGDALEERSSKTSVTELEIVEIFEVEGEKDVPDEMTKKLEEYENQSHSTEIEQVPVLKDIEIVEEEIKLTRRTKRSLPEKEDDEMVSEVVTTETEDETVSELADSVQGHSENSDTDGTLNQATWGIPSTATKVGSTRDNRGREKPQPRRRGRPKKGLSVVDASGNGNDVLKHEIISKQVASLVSRDSEQKTSESDSERSYSGRRRKPNKRYLHSEIYTSSPENRASRTDESQSETEEKSQVQSKGRPRRGKKKSSSGVIDSRVESIEKSKDQEFEFYNRTLDSTDQAAKMEVTGISKIDNELQRVKESMLLEGKLDSIETEGESSASCTMDFAKKLDSGIGSPVNITKLLSLGDSETGSQKQVQDQETKSEKSYQPRDQEQDIHETIAMTPDDAEMSSDETKPSSKFDTLKTTVGKLPPKKSQIKKFELSQIDLLDACAEQVAAEQLAAEKLAAEKIAAEKLAADKIFAERLAAEKIAAEKLATERLAVEKAAAEKLAAEKEAAEKLAAEKLAAEKLAVEKLEAEKLAAEKLAAEKLAAEKLAAEKLAAEKLAAEKLAAEKLAAEKLAAEKLAAEELAAEKLAAEKIAAEALAAVKLSAEKLAAEKLAAEKAAAEELAAEKIVAETLAANKLAAEQAAAEEIATKKLEMEKLAIEEAAAQKTADERRLVEENLTNQLNDTDMTQNNFASTAVTAVDNATEQAVEKVIVDVAPLVSEKGDSTSSVIAPDNVTEAPVKDSTMETIEAVLARITNEETIDENETTQHTSIGGDSKAVGESITSDTGKEDSTSKNENVQTPGDIEISQRSSAPTRYKGKFTPETSSKVKKDKDSADEEIPVNSFQEAFLKTLHVDPNDEKSNKTGLAATMDASSQKVKEYGSVSESVQSTELKLVSAIGGGNNDSYAPSSDIHNSQNILPLNAMTEFEGVEILVQDNIVEVDTKLDEGSTSQMDLAAALVGSDVKSEGTNTLSLDLQKIQDTLSDAVSTPSPTSDVSVPVKKREKPRIIENVALKEPMQILKSKLLEKLPTKSTKHKLDSDITKKGELKGTSGPRAKMMKIDSSNSKARSPTKSGGSHFTITRKLQVLKAEEAATVAAAEKERAVAQAQISTQTINVPTSGEKFIQQSSQSLADMELDINSMPFVLSEDVLTPESIEHMPVVISSIIPSSSTSIPTSLTLTQTSQLMTSNQATQYKSSSETITTESTSSGKKKSGTPAILKNKGKAKPTITSIKTLVPPLTGGVKGLKFQSQQTTGKAMPLVSQKSSATPGKYVIVQTAGGQQMRYSVQGKPGSQQKIAIPAGKATGSAQIVHQGGKVVILTSAQSGQTKMLPLNISKSMSGKVQKIVNNKGQIYTSISTQGLIGSKTMIAPKTDVSSPTTSKLSQGQKMINAQGIITSKGVLTPISPSKGGLLGTLSQGILTKDGIYTPISSAQLAGKTIIGGKTLVSKGTTILSPMSHGLTGKSIINTQGLVTPKGTVLTPITGQQVKAIAAKSPAKGVAGSGGKIHYQSVQQKLQLPMLQKCQKITGSSSPQMRAGGSVKSPGGAGSAIVFQHTITGQQKSVSAGGKKIVRQVVQQGVRSTQTTIAHTTNASTPQFSQRGKTSTQTVQRVVASPRGGVRQTKAQQKIVVQKLQDMSTGATGSSSIINMHTKPITSSSSIGTVVKTPVSSHKQTSRSGKSNRNTQKHLLNVTNLSSISPVGTSETATLPHAQVPTVPISPLLSTTLPVPPLVIPGTEVPISETEGHIGEIEKTSIDSLANESFRHEAAKIVDPTSEVTTMEATKVAAQPQIMALPTESSDGTQTYVLVTIDEQGQIQPLDNNTLMSLEGTTQNADGTRTLYIDPSSLGEAGTLDNIVLHFDNGALPNLQSNVGETSQPIVSTESFPSSEIIQTSNQDILAAALANTDFQQEIGLPDNPTSSNVMTAGLTQTSLINQTILQSTIIPPTEPISSPSVLETSLTLNQPIMTPLEVPSSLPIQVEPAPASVVSTIPTSLELPITITNPNISYISASTVGETGHIQMPGNSMPDIGEIMESPVSSEVVHTEIPPSTRYLVLPRLDEDMAMQAETIETETDSPSTSVTYSVSIPDNIVLDNSQAQTTPSMPIIDDSYVEVAEQSSAQVTVNEMLVPKVAATATTSASGGTPEEDNSITSQEPTELPMEIQKGPSEVTGNDTTSLTQSTCGSQEIIVTEQMVVEQPESVPVSEEVTVKDTTIDTSEDISKEQLPNEKQSSENPSSETMQIDEQSAEVMTTCTPAADGSCDGPSEMHFEVEAQKNMTIESKNLSERQGDTFDEGTTANLSGFNDSLARTNAAEQKASGSSIEDEERTDIGSLDSSSQIPSTAQGPSASEHSRSDMECESMTAEMEVYPSENPETPDGGQSAEDSSRVVIVEPAASENVEVLAEAVITETSQEETPSQSYEQFAPSVVTSDSAEIPTQSATKSENSREPSQSVAYEAMEVDENPVSGEPPTQSFEDTKGNEASQSYEQSVEVNTNAPTQSFNEIMQCQEEGTSAADVVDDQSFPTQSYEVGKMDNLSESLESDGTIGQEGNIPSQSNDIGNDGIGTSSISTNNSGLNEDETASSSYVPETPENQERDQDQESAISTSSYEIPPCEELNIASSSVIPDTSVRGEHMSIHGNGVPEIPTSSYNLNPDSSSTSHVDALPTSSYEDQVIVEQNVSTSYEVPISMPGLEENSSQNFVTESTDHRNEPTSYYARHPEVTASYYETVNQDSNSRLEADPQEEVTPSYYEQPQDITSEASQSYFRSTPRYTSQNVSPSYYDPTPETEASQSYYSHDIEGTEQSSRNVEASQSFYQETSDAMRLRQQGEATPTYTERYPADYALENSPIERHDLVESSVPATRPTER